MQLPYHFEDILVDRYQIIGLLGQGGIGITYKAKDLKTNQVVALKVLSLRRSNSTKVLDLFEREIRILGELNHPAIPKYLDHFQIDQPRDRHFYLVQQLAQGQSLATSIEQGWRPDEATVQQMAIQLLTVLIYLQQLAPPVIHRDIKPQNIIRREDEQLFLVDFGAVQDAYHNTLTGGSTVVGTYGYMAPEQFRGQAVLSTDLYGVGTTLIYLLTQKHPINLPQRKLKLQFRDQVKLSKPFADWLDRLIEPVTEDRFDSAEEALAVLQGEKEFVRTVDQSFDRPPGTPIRLQVAVSQLVVDIPPVWIGNRPSQLFALIPVVFNSFFLLMLWVTIVSGYVVSQAGWIFLSVYGVMGLGLLGIFLHSAMPRVRIELNPQTVRLQKWLLNWCVQDKRQQTTQVTQVIFKPTGLSLNKVPITTSVLVGKRKFRFGTFLTEPEKAWLAAEINRFLERQRAM
ncbi:MAG: serine/threonine protein kinase [Scytolyngbya sp. HA4215-MV1]|jgi:serine/threonine protein kinase|nr:serine/threonine protein kinase [Scytolyngbya sp. HA4215-MV1]